MWEIRIIWTVQLNKNYLEYCKVATLRLLAITPKFSQLQTVIKLEFLEKIYRLKSECCFCQWLTYIQHIKVGGLKFRFSEIVLSRPTKECAYFDFAFWLHFPYFSWNGRPYAWSTIERKASREIKLRHFVIN